MPTYQWIDLIKFDLEKQTYISVARCILAEGQLRFEGNQVVIENLESEFDSFKEEPEAFLEMLVKRFNSPYLQATEIQSGDELAPFQSPEPVSL